ncbi:MAG TPA: FtsH protease activity modulator HflK [Burkholderiaceae bacterium]|jgi:membrane protease subunit HflK
MLASIYKKIGLIFSLNDPKWGNGSQNNNQDQKGDKKPDGPPDLDQLWRDFNQRMNRLFSNKRGGGDSSGGYSPDMKGAGIGLGVIAAIALFLWLISGFFSVQEGQTGIVMTFGKYSYSTPAGFNWRWPYPFQSHEIVNVSQVRNVEIGYRSSIKNKVPSEALMLTEDENIVDIQFAVQYTLKDAADWLFNNRDQDETVKQVAETSIREVVGKSKMDFVLYEGRGAVANSVQQSMQKILDHYKSGVSIREVSLQAVQPPEQVQAAFDDAVKAGQDRERQKSEGQAYANDVIPRASGAASRLKQEAEAYRASVIDNAEGDAARFKQVLTEYAKAPAVTRDRMYLETMQQIFSNTTKIMVDAKNGNNLLYLPLDKLIAQTAVNDANNKPNPVPAPATPTNPPPDSLQMLDPQRQKDSRSRDSRDSRDREGR